MKTRGLRFALPVAAAAVLRFGALALGVGSAGCGEPPTRPPEGAVRLVAPSVYQTWWADVERCAGVTGDIDRIEWYEVPCTAGETGFECPDTPDGLCAGEWKAPHLISLAGPNALFPDGYVNDEFTVKHEILHDLLQTGDHPVTFQECGLMLR
jgi:hypothetical protein